jgi:hypothetical protein
MQQEDCIEIKHKKRRCNEPDCSSGTRDKTGKFVAHGGGKRCDKPDCSASAQGKTDKCKRHGVGKRCDEPDCNAL